MRAPISVVIPTLNAGDALPGTLAALIEGLQAGAIRELVVSDGGSSDHTRQVAEDAGARWVEGPAGRGGQLRRGVVEAQGAWVLLLHADTQFAPGWSATALQHIADHPNQAGYGRLAFQAIGTAPRLVAAWANLRSRIFGLPYGDQGLLISSALLDEVGGVPDLPLMEDVALARALCGRLRPLQITASTSADKYLRGGWARRGSRNLFTLSRYLMGADPHRLADAYRR